MRLNILIGGKAGQGINKVSQIISSILSKYGYYTFNYREYPSLIRGGHNFNILSIADYRIGSYESILDCIIALDEKTESIHKKELKKDGIIIGCGEFCNIGRNANIAQAGALIKLLGIPKEELVNEIIEEFGKENTDAIKAAEDGYQKEKTKYNLKKLNNKVQIRTGSAAVAEGAINSKIDLYISYPMTPATGVMNELANHESENGHMVFQSENEVAVANQALGASFCGAKTMVGTSGGGFDLMTEAFSMQGISEIPLVAYLASRPGPGTGIPTFSSQADLDIALRSGHGEAPRVVIAPGDPIEAIEKTNEAFYLSEKYGVLSIILSDKHLAESEFGSDRTINKIIPVEVKRKVPGEAIIKATSYEHNNDGSTTEDPLVAKKGAEDRIKKYETMKKECRKSFEMIKVHGNKNAKNVIVGWGSNKTVILDSLDSIDESIRNPIKGKWKFLQIIYMKPLSDKIKDELNGAKNIILVESNVTGQLGRLLREKTGIKIEKRILKYDGLPFTSDQLKEEILKFK